MKWLRKRHGALLLSVMLGNALADSFWPGMGYTCLAAIGFAILEGADQ